MADRTVSRHQVFACLHQKALPAGSPGHKGGHTGRFQCLGTALVPVAGSAAMIHHGNGRMNAVGKRQDRELSNGG